MIILFFSNVKLEILVLFFGEQQERVLSRSD